MRLRAVLLQLWLVSRVCGGAEKAGKTDAEVVRCSPAGFAIKTGEYEVSYHAKQAAGFLSIARPSSFPSKAYVTNLGFDFGQGPVLNSPRRIEVSGEKQQGRRFLKSPTTSYRWK